MSPGCHKFEALIDRRASGLSVGEQLLLEEHVQSCPQCLRTLRAMELVTDTLRSASSRLSDSARMRAVTRALDNAGQRRLPEPKPTRWWLGGGLAAAAALLLTWGALRTTDEPTHTAPLAKTDKVVVPAAEASKQPAAAPVEDSWVFAEKSEQRTFGHAKVRLSAGTRARFEQASSTLSLGQGELEVDVDASRGKRFTVLTDLFRVEVLGTQFHVTREQVKVARGSVRITGLDGQVLAGTLTSGETFEFQKATSKQPKSTARVSAKALLTNAREALLQSKVARARELIAEAEAVRPTRREQAEALTLKAECAMLERDLSTAGAQYQLVAKRFSDLPAGENAAFAAAQLALRGSDKERARTLFAAYVARYPKGRFAEEAKARLTSLSGK